MVDEGDSPRGSATRIITKELPVRNPCPCMHLEIEPESETMSLRHRTNGKVVRMDLVLSARPVGKSSVTVVQMAVASNALFDRSSVLQSSLQIKSKCFSSLLALRAHAGWSYCVALKLVRSDIL